jgi:hypothetical protein
MILREKPGVKLFTNRNRDGQDVFDILGESYQDIKKKIDEYIEKEDTDGIIAQHR